MKILEENCCRFCDQIFCCENCRQKHEVRAHALRLKKAFSAISAKAIVSENYIEGYGRILCAICDNKPLPMKEEISKELLQHIEVNHLPLHCQKCSKVYSKLDDLKIFSNCTTEVPSKPDTEVCKSLEPKSSDKLTISTQTSPMLSLDRSFNPHATPPLSILKWHWKSTKVIHEEFISDSVSSIKNLSSINDSTSVKRVSTDNSVSAQTSKALRGKLVRSTSTPVHMEIHCPKPKNQTFDASNGHVSSIHNSGSETNGSPMESASNAVDSGTAKASLETINRYRKTGARPKIASVTPLRHVMSKSIQKAFAEHGGYLSSHKPMLETSQSTSKNISIPNSPLDLRLSPALRRDNEVPDESKLPEKPRIESMKTVKKSHREFIVSARQTTTKSVVITRVEPVPGFSKEANHEENLEELQSNSSRKSTGSSVGNSVFQTCESIEIFTSTSTESNQFNLNGQPENDVDSRNELADQLKPLKCLPNINNNNLDAITPITRLPGSLIGKKLIKFETPHVESSAAIEESPSQEVFYTPQTSPCGKNFYFKKPADQQSNCVRNEKPKYPLSPSRRPPLRSYMRNSGHAESLYCGIEELADDDVLIPPRKDKAKAEKPPDEKVGGSGYLWNLVGAVMRKSSVLAKLVPLGDSTELNSKPKSILRRCASIAGSLVRSTSTDEDDRFQTLKRKRTNTMESFATCPKDQNVISPSNDVSRKRFRIQPRKPIERMRNQS